MLSVVLRSLRTVSGCRAEPSGPKSLLLGRILWPSRASPAGQLLGLCAGVLGSAGLLPRAPGPTMGSLCPLGTEAQPQPPLTPAVNPPAAWGGRREKAGMVWTQPDREVLEVPGSESATTAAAVLDGAAADGEVTAGRQRAGGGLGAQLLSLPVQAAGLVLVSGLSSCPSGLAAGLVLASRLRSCPPGQAVGLVLVSGLSS